MNSNYSRFKLKYNIEDPYFVYKIFEVKIQSKGNKAI